MFYLISKITLCLIIAAVFGFIFGWLFKLFFTKNNIKTDLEECLRKYKDMEKENLDLLNKIQKLQLDNKKITDTKSKLAKKTTPKIAKDDLKKIRGIGTILETRLNKLGVFNVAQIATWTEKDVENFSDKIGPFRGRIMRDKWISQAKKKHQEKHRN